MIKVIKPDLESVLFTTGETLWYLRCSYMTLRKIIQQGLIVPSRVGGRLRFLKSDLDYYLHTPKREIINSIGYLLRRR